MSIIEFGKALLKSEDLDPMYCAVTRAGIDSETLHRLMLAYCCLYHLGAAAKIAEKKGNAFWKLLHEAAVNEGLKWPRGAERRHWRGANSVRSAEYLNRSFKNPEDTFAYWCRALGRDLTTYKAVSGRVQEAVAFGPWIAFKVADIGERVLGYDIDFSDCELGIYKDPRQGAAVAYQELASFGQITQKLWDYPITDDELRGIVKTCVKAFSRLKAPPKLDRPINVQEVETIFCKYKSHLKGHYPLGKDSHELRSALEGWGDLASQIRSHVPGAK